MNFCSKCGAVKLKLSEDCRNPHCEWGKLTKMKKYIVTCQLDLDRAANLELFVKATMSSKASIVRQALDEFIAKALDENPGIRERYEQILGEELEKAKRKRREHLSIVK